MDVKPDIDCQRLVIYPPQRKSFFFHNNMLFVSGKTVDLSNGKQLLPLKFGSGYQQHPARSGHSVAMSNSYFCTLLIRYHYFWHQY